MEPGGGKFALGRLPDGVKLDAPSIVMVPATDPADMFCQRFMVAKCVAAVRAFRSHPSLIQYTLQNETGADFANPATTAILAAMRAEDESRSIILNDGFVGVSTDPASVPYASAAQAWYAPYDFTLHRSDREPWGGWWSDHQGAGDQWVDAFYQGPENFNYRQPLRPQIVAFGEMAACAAPDDHTLLLADIARRGGASYDLEDHRDIAAVHDAFLDRWGFRKAFPTTQDLCRALGRRSYLCWQQYMENVRLNDATDYAAISGWESTAIENHAGLVDNLRNTKSDPAIIRSSLLPLRPLAKQHRLAVAAGESAVFDLYLLNDTSAPVTGTLTFAMTDPAGRRTVLGKFPAPSFASDNFVAPVKQGFTTPPLTQEGAWRFSFSLSGMPRVTHLREIRVADTGLAPSRRQILKIGVAGAPQALTSRLRDVAGTQIEAFSANANHSVLVASGAPGEKPVLAPELLAAVRAGTPLLVLAQEDTLADALATQLAGEGAFSYRGQIGRSRAPWMGSWYFLRAHPAYEGLPMDQAMDLYFQPNGRLSNGLLVDGPDVDVFVGYGRDHDRQLGAGTFTARLGRGKILFQRVPDLTAPLQQRFLCNALAWLCT
jgi:hypothetical protein